MADAQGIIGMLNQIIERYKPGGEFGKGETALLGRAKTKAMATGQQSLVSAGLAGATAGVGMGQRWEEEVGMPAQLRLEDIRSQRLSQAMGAKAGYLQERSVQRSAQQWQAEQARLSRESQEAMQIREMQGPTMASQGMSAFGTPFSRGLGGPSMFTGGPSGPRGGLGATYRGGELVTGEPLSTYGQGYSTGDGDKTAGGDKTTGGDKTAGADETRAVSSPAAQAQADKIETGGGIQSFQEYLAQNPTGSWAVYVNLAAHGKLPKGKTTQTPFKQLAGYAQEKWLD